MSPQASLRLDTDCFTAGQRVCCALSGGADSTALLRALHASNQDKRPLGIVLSAVHVHHGLRGGEADGDEAFVRNLCDRLDIPLTVVAVDTNARREATREGLEEAARELRYGVFRELLANGSADVIATAHTLDDQAETVMMKLMRGTWTEGLGGISPVLRSGEAAELTPRPGGSPSAAFIRPLLGCRRAEIEQYLRTIGQSWREDTSNRDISLTRNRVRHELMPLLRSFNPGIDELLANVATLARDEEAYWAEELRRLVPPLLLPGKPVRGGGRAVSTAVGEKSLSVEIERLRALPPAVRRRVVREAARTVGARLSFEETAKVLALAGFGGHAGVKGVIGSRLELRGGFRAERSARELRLSKSAEGSLTH